MYVQPAELAMIGKWGVMQKESMSLMILMTPRVVYCTTFHCIIPVNPLWDRRIQ